MSASDAIVICYCTCPDAMSAQRLANAVVEERLAACVNRIPGIHSTYRWKGELATDREELLLIKTTASHFEALKDRVLALHPYELPELIAVPVQYGHAGYLEWVRAALAR